MKRLTLSLTLIFWLTACAGQPATPPITATPPPPTLERPTITATSTQAPPAASPTPTPPPPLARPQYQITAALDYGWKTLTAQQQINLPNPSDQALSEVVLVVQPNWYPGVFTLDALTWGDGAAIAAYTLEGIRLTIPLQTPLEPGGTLALKIAYTLSLPPVERGEEYGPNPFGHTTRQINLTDWYPFVPPFVGGEWLVHNPWFYGEHLAYPAADFDVEIELTNAPEGTVIAASAPNLGEGETHRYQLQAARTFALSISPEYRVLEAEVDGVTLYGYSFPFEAAIGEAAFAATVEAFSLYQQLFGPYPHASLSLVQADFLHGMEYDGLVFLSKAFYATYDGTPASYLVAIAVHETAHQWWFGVVGNDQALEPWLDEALCTYTELLYYEHLHPEALQWWWDYRVEYYEPQGWVDLTIYDAGGYRPYRDAVYLNGMKFLLALRELVGAEVFAAFLREYAAQNAGGIATHEGFFALLGEHSSADWGEIKARYFRAP